MLGVVILERPLLYISLMHLAVEGPHTLCDPRGLGYCRSCVKAVRELTWWCLVCSNLSRLGTLPLFLYKDIDC